MAAPDRVRAALHLIDWLGCALAGASGPAGRAIAQGAKAGANPFSATGVAGATAMGGLGSLLEMDDVHRTALLHPGPVVIPAALAVAHHMGADILAAILAGYETMVRLGAAVGPAQTCRHRTVDLSQR